jgi:hypothetical protein
MPELYSTDDLRDAFEPLRDKIHTLAHSVDAVMREEKGISAPDTIVVLCHLLGSVVIGASPNRSDRQGLVYEAMTILASMCAANERGETEQIIVERSH